VPLDLGTFEISLKPDFKLGQTAAPEFEATDIEGRKFKLSNFHGKYVLLTSGPPGAARVSARSRT
jgi:hypothetical protein